MSSHGRCLNYVALFSLLLFVESPPVAAAPVVSVSPLEQLVPIGGTGSIEVRIADVTDLFAFQFDVHFDPALLAADAIFEGTFLASGGATIFDTGTIDNVAGTISFTADTLIGPVLGVSGSGVLAIIDFHALPETIGASPIDLQNIVLLDAFLSEITPFSAKPGQVSVVFQPSALGLLVAGLGGLLGLRRRITRGSPGPRGKIAKRLLESGRETPHAGGGRAWPT